MFEGTPVQNDLQEFYAIIEFVNPGILGSSTAYRKVYEEPILRSRQPGCTEVTLLLPVLLQSAALLCSQGSFVFISHLSMPKGGEDFGRGASSRAVTTDWHVHPEEDAGDHQPLPASSSGLDTVL